MVGYNLHDSIYFFEISNPLNFCERKNHERLNPLFTLCVWLHFVWFLEYYMHLTCPSLRSVMWILWRNIMIFRFKYQIHFGYVILYIYFTPGATKNYIRCSCVHVIYPHLSKEQHKKHLFYFILPLFPINFLCVIDSIIFTILFDMRMQYLNFENFVLVFEMCQW